MRDVIKEAISAINSGKSEIDLKKKDINFGEIYDLTVPLQVSTTVKFLDLSSNYLVEKGTRQLGEILKSNKSIEELSIKKNDIMPEGASEFAEKIKRNESLKKIDFSNNWILNGGATILGALASREQSMEEIYCNHTGIDNTAIAHLKILIEKGLKILHIENNLINEQGAKELFQTCDGRQIEVKIEDNDFENDQLINEFAKLSKNNEEAASFSKQQKFWGQNENGVTDLNPNDSDVVKEGAHEQNGFTNSVKV